jgi:hypothetical protein
MDTLANNSQLKLSVMLIIVIMMVIDGVNGLMVNAKENTYAMIN